LLPEGTKKTQNKMQNKIHSFKVNVCSFLKEIKIFSKLTTETQFENLKGFHISLQVRFGNYFSYAGYNQFRLYAKAPHKIK
jgi:hypothetical protein